MVKLTVQHFVYDFCLGMVLDNLSNNFGAVDSSVPKKGDYYRRVSHKFNDEHYYNCLVKNVEMKPTSDGREFYIVYLKYDYAKGADFEEWQNRMADIDAMDDSEFELLSEEELTEMDELFIDEDLESDDIDETVEFIEFDDCVGLNTEFYDFHP